MNVLFFHRYVVMTSAKLPLKLRGRQPRPLRFFSTFDPDKLGKTRRHHWKELPKISKIAQFESDLLKTKDDSVLKVAKFCRRLYGGGGVGQKPAPHPTIQTSVNFCNFPELYRCSLKTYHFRIWQSYFF